MQDPAPEELDFIRACAPENLSSFLKKCAFFGDFLYETNEFLNLTRVPKEDFWTKHVCDSLALARCFPLATKSSPPLKLCDAGCGAGLPSMILAAAFPGLSVTALDSRGKKIDFVKQAAEKTGIRNLRAVHARAGEFAHRDEGRCAFSLVTARAVASLEELIRETRGLLADNGTLAVYRTPGQAETELEGLRKQKYAPSVERSATFELPGGAEKNGKRLFLFLKKNTLR